MIDTDEIEAMSRRLELGIGTPEEIPAAESVMDEGAAMLRRLQAENMRLRADNTEFLILLDAARLLMRLLIKGRDRRPDEMRIYDAIRAALAKSPPQG